MAIPDGVKMKSAKLVEKTRHAFAFLYYLHPTRSRRNKREAIVKTKAIATGAIFRQIFQYALCLIPIHFCILADRRSLNEPRKKIQIFDLELMIDRSVGKGGCGLR